MFSSLKFVFNELFRTEANRITLSRLLFLPIFVVYQDWGMYAIAFTILSYMVYADALDGHSARMKNEVSALGERLDPATDKIIIVTVFIEILKSLYLNVPCILWWSIFWRSVLLFSQEAFLTFIGIYAMRSGVRGGSNVFGKAKMFTECVIMGICYDGLFLETGFSIKNVGSLMRDMLIPANVLAFLSIVGYIRKLKKYKE